MSYMLRPEDEEESESGHRHVHILTHEPISLKRIGIAVSLGSVIILALAGVPSFSRHHRLPATDGLAHGLPDARLTECVHVFPELENPVDPVSSQRPPYPTTAELDARLQAVTGWHDAVLLALDATAADLAACGLSEPGLCATLLQGRQEEPWSWTIHWRLLLLDEHQHVVGREDLEIAAAGSRQMTVGDADITKAPLLDDRMPDWPRVAVFTRNAAELPSDG